MQREERLRNQKMIIRRLVNNSDFQAFMDIVKALKKEHTKDALTFIDMHKVYRAQGAQSSLESIENLVESALEPDIQKRPETKDWT